VFTPRDLYTISEKFKNKAFLYDKCEHILIC